MTFAEIIEQLEFCEYECEGGPLELNTAFIELKAMTATWETFQVLYDAVDDYIYSPNEKGYPEGHHNQEYLAALHTAFLNAADALETETQARAAIVGARGGG